jgi:SLOG family YspA-like protein
VRAIIAGDQTITDPAVLVAALAAYPFTDAIEDVIESGEPGIATLAAAWAQQRGLGHTRVAAPDWKKHGDKAGPRRNETMAQLANALIAIYCGVPDSATTSMLAQAERYDLHVFVFELDQKEAA